MRFNDKKFATVMFYLFLLPTIFFWFMTAGSVIWLIAAFSGQITGSAAAGGSFVIIFLIIFAPLALGFTSMERAYRKRMRASPIDSVKNTGTR